VRPVSGFLSWWDGIELWISGLAFVLQALLVMPVVLMLAYILAAVLDRLLGKGIRLMRRARRADAALG
jgi:membrane protein implicated in regulation of membrane protease activity